LTYRAPSGDSRNPGMSLSSLLVQREIATIREIEEALARQVLYGGDLITNLLEVTHISEDVLISAAADLHGVPPAPGGTLPVPSAEARQLVPGEVVATHAIVPLSVDRYGLVVAVSEPLSRQSEQELAFALAMPIAQRLTSQVRIREALARDYSLPLERRFVRLLARLRGEIVESTSSLPPRMPDVVSLSPRAPAVPSVHVTTRGMPAVKPEQRAPQLLKRSNAPPAAAAKRRRGPMTVDDARNELDEAAARDDVFNLLFEFARQYFDYTAIFIVHGDVAEGRDAFGTGAAREKVARIGVPLDLPGVLATSRDRRSVVTMTPTGDGLDAVLMTDLGRPLNQPITVIPVTVRTRVVALILGDGGAAGVDEASVAEVIGMVTHAVAAFERVIMQRKLRGSAPAPAIPSTKSSPAREPLASSPEPGSRLLGVDDMGGQLQEMLAGPPDPPQRSQRSGPPTYVSAGGDESTLVSAEPAPGGVDWPGPRESIEMVAVEPPPANVMLVRRPTSPPIPREEPESVERIEVGARYPDVTGPGGTTPPEARSRPPRSRRAEAPAFDFSRRPTPPEVPRTERDGGDDEPARFSVGFAGDEVERALLAEIHGGPVFSEPPASPDEDAGEAAQLSVGDYPSSPPQRAPLHRSSGSGALEQIRAGSAPPPATTRDLEAPAMTPASPAARLASPVVLTAPDAGLAPLDALPSEPSPRAVSPPPPASPSAHVDALPPAPALPSATTLTSGLPVLPSGPTRRTEPPPSEKHSVAAHRPPSSRSDGPEALPSVIVDVGQEYVELVRRVVEREGEGRDEDAESALTRAGGAAMSAIMARFPGPDALEPEKVLAGKLPRVGECGRVLRLIALQRRTALPYVLACVEDSSAVRRFWATFLLTELAYVEALDGLVRRVFDVDERVRAVARAAGRAASEAMPGLFVERVAAIVSDAANPKERREQGVAALGATRDPAAVPVLIGMLERDVADAAAAALVELARQDYGTDRARWARWWNEHKDRHRVEWLIDALMHDQHAVRAAAGEELKATTREFFGYYDDLPKRERMRAQSKFREWWKATGRVKFAHTSRA
jgi:hypothetical protein